MKEKVRSYFGDLMLLTVAILWGFGFVAVKIGLNSGMNAYHLLFLRFTIAALLLLLILNKRIKQISLRTWKRGSILGVLLFLGFAFQTVGLAYTSTSKNAFLTGVNVVLVPFLTYLLTKKKVDIYSTIAAFLCLIGIGLLTLDGSLTINIGDALTLVCAVMFAGHITVTSIVAKDEKAENLVFVQMASAAFLSLIASLISREPFDVNTSSLLAILYLGMFSTMFAFFLQTMGQKYSTATKAAIILSTESLFGAILAVIFLKDRFTLQIILGCICVFAAIILSETKLSFLKKNSLVEIEENNQ